MADATVDADEATRTRDLRLDLWRGICLVDMAWVHFARYPIGMPDTAAAWIGDHTRFAAGAFVLLSGLTVSRVFAPRLDAGGAAARRATGRMLRRALLLLFLDRAASLAFAAIERVRTVPPGVRLALPGWWSLATFGEAGATGGLLLLYAMLLAATPGLQALRRRLGDGVLLLASALAYAAAYAAGPAAHWPPWAFPLAFWQPFYVLGYVLGPRLDSLVAPARRAGSVLTAAAIAYGAMFLVRNGEALGLAPAVLPPGSFEKVPLQPAELAWYLCSAAFVMSGSAWLFALGPRVRAACSWLCLVGRRSLLVYVAHLLVEPAVLEALTLTDPSPRNRALVLPAVTAVLVALAAAAEAWDRRRPRASGLPEPLARVRVPASGLVGAVAAVVMLCAVLTLQAVLRAPWIADAARATSSLDEAEICPVLADADTSPDPSVSEDDVLDEQARTTGAGDGSTATA